MLDFFAALPEHLPRNYPRRVVNMTDEVANVAGARQGPNFNALEYSPELNPLVVVEDVSIKRRRVKTGVSRSLVDTSTGEVSHVAAIYSVEEKDDKEFVKIYAEGVKAAFGLSRTAYRVFTMVLEHYQSMPMSGGFSDSVFIAWFDGGLLGLKVANMSERTFRDGLRELMAKKFLAPRYPNMYWINPTLFFKGDRVAFVREYQRKKSAPQKVADERQAGLFGDGAGNE
jgi:hypothetical protein